MPIIAQIMVPMQFKDDGTVEILKKKIYKCGCLDLAVESGRLNTPVAHLLKVMRSIDGVVCDDDGMCCATDISGFADKLKKFRRKS